MTALQQYRRKRDFSKTREPMGAVASAGGGVFVVQKHDARALHYDFRLEHEGVLLSWAVPKGPSLDPRVKRLAMQVEDHPLDYGTFEGTIPEGQYGAGTVLVWDRGTWHPDGDVSKMLRDGHLRFSLDGHKLRGGFTLLKAGKPDKAGRQRWLLIKRKDDEARAGTGDSLLRAAPNSVITGRGLSETAQAAPDNGGAASPGSATRDEARRVFQTELETSGATRGKLPAFVGPQLALLTDEAPTGAQWFHEIKLDGYRMLARVDGGKTALLSRRGNDWSGKLPLVTGAVSSLGLISGIIDGEVVVFDEQGVSDFQQLQNSLEEGKDEACVYVAFDLLFANGYDLRSLPLSKRKALLQRLCNDASNKRRLRFCEHVVGHGPQFFQRACELGLEGTIAKRADSAYRSDRNGDWRKCKCGQRQEFVIGGYTAPAGSRHHFGALLLGLWTDQGLTYVGKVGTGFSERSLLELAQRMKPLAQAQCPFASRPRLASKHVKWIEPKLVAEVRFAERTRDGLLRQAAFLGLRQDKPASDVHEEPVRNSVTAAAVQGQPSQPRKTTRSRPENPDPARLSDPATFTSAKPRLSHPERVLFQQSGVTKLDLATHYARVASWMLPHVSERPLMIRRCPAGAGSGCFFQKHPSRGMPEAIHTAAIPEKSGAKHHLFISDLEGLLALVQLDALEIHAWGAKIDRVEYPDRLVFDLDPDPTVGWRAVVEAAFTVRDALTRTGLTSFVKTTGGKGLHVVTPVVPKADWDEAKAFCKALVSALAAAEPAKYLTTMTKQKRQGKIFLDYLRNGRGATAVCPFSTRDNPSASVSTPLTWRELESADRPLSFDVRSVATRLARLEADPWADFEAAARQIRHTSTA
jgi:bifunctional non-homologous end joining protein LigD